MGGGARSAGDDRPGGLSYVVFESGTGVVRYAGDAVDLAVAERVGASVGTREGGFLSGVIAANTKLLRCEEGVSGKLSISCCNYGWKIFVISGN
jgi:hypothetical protein